MRTTPEGAVWFWPVGREVGNVRKDGPHVVLPLKVPDRADSADPPGPNPA